MTSVTKFHKLDYLKQWQQQQNDSVTVLEARSPKSTYQQLHTLSEDSQEKLFQSYLLGLVLPTIFHVSWFGGVSLQSLPLKSDSILPMYLSSCYLPSVYIYLSFSFLFYKGISHVGLGSILMTLTWLHLPKTLFPDKVTFRYGSCDLTYFFEGCDQSITGTKKCP
jgi:hypothetical protein